MKNAKMQTVIIDAETSRIVQRAARLAALLALYEAGMLKNLTYQQIADLTGKGHRSTGMRDIQALESVARMRDALLSAYMATLKGSNE